MDADVEPDPDETMLVETGWLKPVTSCWAGAEPELSVAIDNTVLRELVIGGETGSEAVNGPEDMAAVEDVFDASSEALATELFVADSAGAVERSVGVVLPGAISTSIEDLE